MEQYWKGVSKLTALDLIFDCTITDDMEVVTSENYDFYSIMPDGKFILMRNKSFMNELNYFLEFITGEESFDWQSKGDNLYLDYSKFEYFRGITIEGELPIKEPVQRNQLIAIRGTCNHACPLNIEQYDGYALREIPSCNGKLVGTTIWSCRYAAFDDFMWDVFMWMRQCKGLDVLIINFDFTPNEYEPELDFGFVCYSILIQGNVIKFLSNKKEIEKLYKKYATTYECTDYIIEDSISYPEKGFYFEFDKPSGCKM